MTIRCKGKHSHLKKPEGGALWNALELNCIAAAFPQETVLTSRGIRKALKNQGLKLRCTPTQLNNYVKNHRKVTQTSCNKGKGVPIETLKQHFLSWYEEQPPMDKHHVAAVCILHEIRQPVVTEERVYVPFACYGMLCRLKSAKNKALKVVVDVKQSIVCNRWGVFTAALLESREDTTWTSVRNGAVKKRMEAHTGTAQPIFQAVINTECEENMTWAFEDLVALFDKWADFVLKHQLIQIHKDYVQGIEKARVKVFPTTRCMDDYFHMKQAVGPQMQSKLKFNKVTDAPTVGSDTEAPGDPVATDSAAAEGLSDNGLSIYGKRAGSQAATQPKAKAKGKAKGKRKDQVVKKYKSQFMAALDKTRILASLQLYDALWRVIFHMMEHKWKEPVAAQYLFDWYFKEVPLDVLRKVFKLLHAGCWGKQTMYFSGHWYGILGTFPGSGSGSLSLEARHSDWSKDIQEDSRVDVLKILPAMQKLYDTWTDTFQWEKEIPYHGSPTVYNEGLINGATLRTVGRSTAVDFWRKRTEGNHVSIVRQTGQLEHASLNVNTTFHVMRCLKVEGVQPADASVSMETAEHIVDLITSYGQKLQDSLYSSGVVQNEPFTADWQVDFERMSFLLCSHCVVITGHLAAAYWPRYKRSAREQVPVILCTCLFYVQHAECEHEYFISCKECGRPILADAPDTRKVGRKRKQQ